MNLPYFSVDDGLFYFTEKLHQLTWLPTIWHLEQGFGTSALVRLWYDYPVQLFIKFFTTLGFSWWVTDKLLWMLPVLIGIVSSWKLARHLSLSKISSALASIIYVTNTYFLLLFGGGQLGVALGYGLAPYVLLKFIEMIDSNTASSSLIAGELKRGLQTGLWLALLVVFDLRLAYLIIAAAGLYYLLQIVRKFKFKEILRQIAAVFIISGIIAALLHLFWILPTLLASGGISDLGEQFTNPGMLKFLSVADFSHAFALLHPNWPENLFGKVYFMQQEFLILPLLAFSSLAWIGQKSINNKQPNRLPFSVYCLYFAMLAIIGAFLSKGVNEPFGGIFQWMFIHIPGFVMFRDPTKFYLFTAIGYSVLIPFTLENIYRLVADFRLWTMDYGLKKISKSKIQYLISIIFFVFWLFTIRAVFTGQVTGNFRPLQLPQEYVRLKDLLVADTTSSRTLWVPANEKFAYVSDIHPLLTSNQVFNNASLSAVTEMIKKPEFMRNLSDAGVGYVIVPTDLEKRIFLSDYKFNPEDRDILINALRKTRLQQVNGFSDVAVFTNNQFTFKQEIPEVVQRQQFWANIGLGISVITFIGATVTIMVLKRRK